MDPFIGKTSSIITINGIKSNQSGNIKLSLDSLSDVIILSPLDGDIIKYDHLAKVFKNYPFNGDGVGSLTSLSECSISSPSDNQALTYESSSGKWKNKQIDHFSLLNIGTSSHDKIDRDLTKLNTVVIDTNTIKVGGEAWTIANSSGILKFNTDKMMLYGTGDLTLAGNFLCQSSISVTGTTNLVGAVSTGSNLVCNGNLSVIGSIPSVTKCTDVSTSNILNDQVLKYNSTSSKWENKTLPLTYGNMTVQSIHMILYDDFQIQTSTETDFVLYNCYLSYATSMPVSYVFDLSQIPNNGKEYHIYLPLNALTVGYVIQIQLNNSTVNDKIYFDTAYLSNINIYFQGANPGSIANKTYIFTYCAPHQNPENTLDPRYSWLMKLSPIGNFINITSNLVLVHTENCNMIMNAVVSTPVNGQELNIRNIGQYSGYNYVTLGGYNGNNYCGSEYTPTAPVNYYSTTFIYVGEGYSGTFYEV